MTIPSTPSLDVAYTELTTALKAAAEAWALLPGGYTLPIESDNRKLVDLGSVEAQKPFVSWEIKFRGGGQMSLGQNPLARQYGQFIIAVKVKEGSGAKASLALVNHILPFLQLKELGVTTTLAAEVMDSVTRQGWYAVPVIINFWVTSIIPTEKTVWKPEDFRPYHTRASAAWAFNESNVLTQYGVNVLRVVPSPTGLLGAFREPQSTNSIKNNSMVGAAAGSPGTPPVGWGATGTLNGITATIVGVGLEDGIPYTDVRWQGTASATSGSQVTMGQVTDVPAAPAQTWTASAFVRMIAGSLAGVTPGVQFNTFNASSTYMTSIATSVGPTNAPLRTQRTAVTGVLPALTAFLVPYVRIGYSIGAVIDVTLRIGAPQLEQYPAMTSPILTTTAAVTRARDQIMLPVSYAAAVPLTLFLDFNLLSQAAAASRITGGNGIGVALATNLAADGWNGSVSFSTANFATLNTRTKVAMTADSQSRVLCLKGANPVMSPSPNAAVDGLLIGQLGANNDGQSPAVFIHEVGLTRETVTPAVLKSMTA